MLSRMPPLQLDFSDKEIRMRRNTFALLLIIGISVSLLLFNYSNLLVQISNVKNQDNALLEKNSQLSDEEPPTAQDVESINALMKIEQKLSLAWEPLLNAISSSVINEVVLLSFQPNANRRELTMMGAATKIPAVLQFVEKLRTQPNLKDVYLKEHETDAIENTRFPVHFTITLRWEDPQ